MSVLHVDGVPVRLERTGGEWTAVVGPFGLVHCNGFSAWQAMAGFVAHLYGHDAVDSAAA